MKKIPLKEAIENDLEELDLEKRETDGFTLSSLFMWQREEVQIEIKDKEIKTTQKDEIIGELVKQSQDGIYKKVKQFCIDNFTGLSPRNWDFFKNISSPRNLERICKFILPITMLGGIELKEAKTNPRYAGFFETVSLAIAKSPDKYTQIFSDLIWDSITDLYGKYVEIPKNRKKGLKTISYNKAKEKEKDNMATKGTDKTITISNLEELRPGIKGTLGWVRFLLEVLIDITRENDFTSWLFNDIICSLIEKCETKEKRMVFYSLFTQFPTETRLIDSILRTANISVDIGLDIIEFLKIMDENVLSNFLYQSARVKHLNFFFKLYTLRIIGDIDYKATALEYLLKVRPELLDRHYNSWQKKISDTTLDKSRIKELRSFIGNLIEKNRRNLVFSDEIEQYISKKWKTVEKVQESGVKIYKKAAPSKLLGLIRDGWVKKAFKNFIAELDEDNSLFNAIDGTGIARMPKLIPMKFKDSPWIMTRNGYLIGLGLSGLSLKEVPEFTRTSESLRILDLSNNLIENIENFGPFPRLSHLDISRNRLNTISVNKACLNLKLLDLHGNFFKQIDLRAFSQSLKYLDVSHNQINDIKEISGLELCGNVSIINIGWNKLQRLDHFPNLPKLVYLFLTGNNLVKLGRIRRIPSLRVFHAPYNYLRSLKEFIKFPKVFDINLDHNYVLNLNKIEELKSLKKLSLLENDIQDIEDFGFVRQLESVNLWGNPLTDINTQEKRYSLLRM